MVLVSCVCTGGYCVLSVELLLQVVFDNLISLSSLLPGCEKSLSYLLPICLLHLVVEFGGCTSGFRLPLYPLAATMYHYQVSLCYVCVFTYLFLPYLLYYSFLTLTGSSPAACCLLNSYSVQVVTYGDDMRWEWITSMNMKWMNEIILYTTKATWRHLSFPAQLQLAAHWLLHWSCMC